MKKMNLIFIGALAGGLSGALGFLIAGKFHGTEKREHIYPLYSATFFGLFLLTIRLMTA